MMNPALGWPDNNMLEAAWGIIANAGGGNWNRETPEWRVAASNWRDAYDRTLPSDQLTHNQQ